MIAPSAPAPLRLLPTLAGWAGLAAASAAIAGLLTLAALPAALLLGPMLAAIGFVRGQAQTLVGEPEVFDEADYLRRHADVAEAVAAGTVASGYRHFVQSGVREGRAARRVATRAGEASFWWARLLHEVSGLEAGVAARGRAIAGLRDRLAVRRLLPDTAPADRPAVAEEGWVRWGGGEVRALPCPVCDAGGPHAVTLQVGLAVLVRCGGCGSAFYADRTEHDYTDAPAAAVAEQFGLEQNSSIHHQTRLLFGASGAQSVLDVGCGFGFAVDMAASVLGWRAVGVDPSPAAAAGRAQLGAGIRQEWLSAELALGAPFDRVIASEVIEHVAEPYATLALLRARLAPGGTLALSTPNAAAIEPGADRGRLTGILAPGVHLTLFTAGSLALALRRAGFAHVAVADGADTLVAEASDWPLQASDGAAHGAAYEAYLRGLLGRAAVGGALWNGAAGRLLTLLAPSGALAEVDALFEVVAAAWRERFGLDLAGPALPAALSEAEIRTIGAAALGQRQPFNLAPVLWSRAVALQRAGAAETAVLLYAVAAHRIAVETRRVLQAENMIDLELKRVAWEARLRSVACLAALAPSLEGTLWQAVAAGSPGEARDWDDPPAEAMLMRVAAVFTAAVATDRFDEARRVEPAMADAEALVEALGADPGLLLRTLFTRGVQRLAGHGDAAGALLAFERLAAEARRLGAMDYERLADEHMAMAARRLREG